MTRRTVAEPARRRRRGALLVGTGLAAVLATGVGALGTGWTAAAARPLFPAGASWTATTGAARPAAAGATAGTAGPASPGSDAAGSSAYDAAGPDAAGLGAKGTPLPGPVVPMRAEPAVSRQVGPATAATAATASTPAADPAAAAAPRLYARPTPAWAVRPPDNVTVAYAKVPSLSTYYKPNQRKGVLIRLKNPTPQGLPLTVVSFGRQGDYLYVLLPVRPNQTFAWVKAKDVTQYSNPLRMEISQRRHTMLVWNNRTVIGSFPVATGTGGTPTPNGYFFTNAILPQANPYGDYGPVIMSTSGFSEVFSTFGGGEAAIGIHGTANRGSVGTSASHGCIRMHNEDIALLAATLPVGTLVVIHP